MNASMTSCESVTETLSPIPRMLPPLSRVGFTKTRPKREVWALCGDGVRVEHANEIVPAIEQAIASPKPFLIDAIVRLIPGVLGCAQSAVQESFENGLLDHPQYTRPRVYRGMDVPEVLVSGNHGAVERWRSEAADRLTRQRQRDQRD